MTSYGGAISWNCKRQPTIALSSTEAEYMATTTTIQEVIWVRNYLEEIFKEKLDSTIIFCDNKGALSILNNNSFSSRTKHIDIKSRFVQEHVESNEIKLEYLPTNCMPADMLTKATGINSLLTHIPTIGLNNPIIG